MTLTPEGHAPDDSRIQAMFYPVGRVAASYRLGLWDDTEAEIVPFEIASLLELVESFKEPIYGWDFFDCDGDFEQWKDRLSLDLRLSEEGRSTSITLFQEGIDCHLDLRIWFDALELRDASGNSLEIEDIVAGGKRWWEAFRANDPRTHVRGMFFVKD